MRHRMRYRIALALVLAACAVPAVAHAQDAAGAEVLFQKGHQLFEQKKYAEACPKFSESYRLDPVTGSLLALASCHEAEGKLATAWAEYVEVATRARREGKNERADAAQQRAATLEPKLARLTVAVAQGADVPGLQVKRDGVVIGSGTFGTALPVDRGEHTVEASAPAHQSFSKRVTMADGASESVAIPVLAASSNAEPAATAPTPAPVPLAAAEPEKSSGGGLRTAGFVTGAVGLVALGLGGYFGISAISKNSDSNTTGCSAETDICTGTGTATRKDAVSAGNTSTALIVVGGLLTAGGIVMIVVGGKPSTADRAPAKTAVAAAPVVGPGTAGFALSGRF